MASLSSLFTEFECSQYDNFAALPDWYVKNYDVLRGRVRELKINSTTTWLLSGANNQIYMMFWWDPTNVEAQIKCTFEINLPEGEKLDSLKKKLVTWLKTEGYKDVMADGKIQKMAVNVDNIDSVLTLWKAFWS